MTRRAKMSWTVALMALCAAVSHAQLISSWSFDEAASGTGTALDAVGGNHGTFAGAATRTAGLIGMGAALFNHTPGGVNVGNGGGDFSFSAGMTVEALIQPAVALGGQRYEEVFRKEDGDNRILLSFQEWGGILSFGINDGTGYKELDMPLDGASGRPVLADLTNGAPHHIAATYDSTSGHKAIYVDGTERFSTTVGAGVSMISGGATAAFIGSSAGGAEPFVGVIDEVGVHDEALSAATVAAHYALVQGGQSYLPAPPPPPAPPPVVAVADYSDTFTLTAAGGNPGRVANAYPVNSPGINVEDNHGNPAQVWTNARWSVSSDAAVNDAGATKYLGGSGRGSDTGMTQTGGGGVDWGIEYGQRDVFAVQADFVQTTDRIDMTVGAARDTIWNAGNVSVFFRHTAHPLYPEIGIFNPAVGERNTGLASGIAAAGEWHNYGVKVNVPDRLLEVFVDEVSRGVIDLDVVGGGAFQGVALSNAAVGVGYAGGDRGWSDNFQVGAPPPVAMSGVPAGTSALIAGLDYSDSFRLTTKGGNAGRVNNVFPINLPGITVENTHGNPLQAWTNFAWSISSDAAVNDAGATKYQGGSNAGSATGMTQRGGGGGDWSIDYGLRTDFVVQTDFVQTTDRVDIVVGAARDTIGNAGNLSVFFRATGHGLPEIGLYNPAIGERNTRLTTGIDAAGEWHNYAVRYNLADNKLLMFVDEQYRGAVNLNTFEGGAFAALGITPSAVGVGYAGGDRGWSDNFQVGAPGDAANPPRLAGIIPDYSDTFTLGLNARANGTFNTGSPAYDIESAHGNPNVVWTQGTGFSFNDIPGSIPPGGPAILGAAGGNPGAATGLAQSGGGDFTVAYGLRDDYIVSVDAILPLDRLDIISVAAPGASIFSTDSLSVFFRRDSSTLGAIGLYDGAVETWALPPGGLGIDDLDWHNFAVRFDQEGDRLLAYVDSVLMVDLDLTTFAGGRYADYSNAAVGVGGAGYDFGQGRVLWVDNFQVGKLIPEPATMALLGLGLVALVRRKRR